MKKRYTEEQIIAFLREADAGLPVKELCRKHGFSEPSYYAWKAKFGGMNWAAAGFTDTLLRWKMKPEVFHGEKKDIQSRVQA
jgi:putative transposase